MITAQEWTQIKEQLENLHVSISFRLDGRRITIQKRQISDCRLGLCVFIDGVLHAGANIKDSKDYDPLTERVWRRINRTVDPWRKTRKKKSERAYLKRMGFVPTVVICYSPIFNSAKSLVSQYKKIEGLELWEEGE